jgi:hypothetical protein
MAKNGSSIALAGRLSWIEAELAIKKQRRRRVEQQAAGLRSAVVRLQAVIAKQKAVEAERRAKHV